VPPGESYPGFYGPYAARVKRIDGCFGQFIETLKRTRLYDDSVVVISPSRFELFTLVGDSAIESKTRDYNQTLQGPEDPQSLEQEGQSLYTLLIAPVEKLIPRDAKVVIVPDGGLTKLNFETLRSPHPTPHFWIQDVELETASSSVFVRNREEVSLEGRKAFLIGDPVQASNDYPALPHAGEELQRVEAHFAPNQRMIIDGKQAIPAAYAAGHPERFGLIHFVTHGTASELSPLESAIILSPQAENDFKLYARDIVKIPLKADLVTISACYGLGRRTYSGEGLVGLAWAFLRAGAHNVIAALWEVNDTSTPQFMDAMYDRLRAGKSPSQALRFAKLKMLHSQTVCRRASYWGAFQCYAGY
jgi:CHAT domain-containing protein